MVAKAFLAITPRVSADHGSLYPLPRAVDEEIDRQSLRRIVRWYEEPALRNELPCRRPLSPVTVLRPLRELRFKSRGLRCRQGPPRQPGGALLQAREEVHGDAERVHAVASHVTEQAGLPHAPPSALALPSALPPLARTHSPPALFPTLRDRVGRVPHTATLPTGE